MKSLIFTALAIICLLLSSCKKDKNCPQGPVNTNCVCPGVVNKVCGCNNRTYENSCQAECDGITTYTAGQCP
jgi:hypothetical protein